MDKSELRNKSLTIRRDLENKVVHYSYYWFDQKKKLCFVLLMI